MQQLVKAIKHPIRFLLHITKNGITCSKASFGRINKEMRYKFYKCKHQKQIPRNTPRQKTYTY